MTHANQPTSPQRPASRTAELALTAALALATLALTYLLIRGTDADLALVASGSGGCPSCPGNAAAPATTPGGAHP